MPCGNLIIYSSSNGQFSANSRTSVITFLVSIRQNEQDYLWEIFASLQGMSSDKRDSAISWNKMNLTLPCENLTFYSSRLSSNRSNVGKMELVHSKFLTDLLQAIYDRPREVRLHYKPSYIYIYPIIHSIWSWIMKKIKIKSWRNGF